MLPDDPLVTIDTIQAEVPTITVETVEFEGEGDFCRAYTVNGDWLFRFAYNEEGSRALEREIALLPRLVPTLSLPVPTITYSGRQHRNGFLFVGYPRITGVPLTFAFLQTLQPTEQEPFARDLALFLRGLHSFSIEEARVLGVPACEYPFCRTEDGIIEGSAAELYNRESERLLNHPLLDRYLDQMTAGRVRTYVGMVVKALLHEPKRGDLPLALVHGDLSSEHILFDPTTRRITGIIDFSDAVITTPLLDFVYLWGAYGPDFSDLLLNHYEVDAGHLVMYRIRYLRRWHVALRLLWALDHDYEPGIKNWSLELLSHSDSVAK
ncbi:MAG: phosphotransferase [Chloroflexia bacterium]